MKTNFNFYLDQKVTAWMRTHLSIEAESYEEAKAKCIQIVNSGETDLIEWDEVDDTKELMTPSENQGKPTQELFGTHESGTFWNNKPTT